MGYAAGQHTREQSSTTFSFWSACCRHKTVHQKRAVLRAHRDISSFAWKLLSSHYTPSHGRQSLGQDKEYSHMDVQHPTCEQSQQTARHKHIWCAITLKPLLPGAFVGQINLLGFKKGKSNYSNKEDASSWNYKITKDEPKKFTAFSGFLFIFYSKDFDLQSNLEYQCLSVLTSKDTIQISFSLTQLWQVLYSLLLVTLLQPALFIPHRNLQPNMS